MENFVLYLIIINVVGVILSAINLRLYRHTEKGQIDVLQMIAAALGGSLGILLFILLFDRKATKENMMSRVLIACLFVVQAVLILVFKGMRSEAILAPVRGFLRNNNTAVLIYLGAVNAVTLIAFAVDKLKAKGNGSRIRIVTLLGLCFIGGSVGGLCGMYLFRHKTKKDYFRVGIPVIMVMQAVVTAYFMLF